jgi:hypothetical protein
MKLFALVAFVLNAIIGTAYMRTDKDKSKAAIMADRLCCFNTILNATICLYVMFGW